MELTEFLLARIAEDESAARVCAEAFPSPWEVVDRGHSATVATDEPYMAVASLDQADETPGRWPGDHLDHIARHDPARVLATVEAYRKIVALHGHVTVRLIDGPIEACTTCGSTDDAPVDWPCDTLRALASIWADGDDHDPAWEA